MNTVTSPYGPVMFAVGLYTVPLASTYLQIVFLKLLNWGKYHIYLSNKLLENPIACTISCTNRLYMISPLALILVRAFNGQWVYLKHEKLNTRQCSTFECVEVLCHVLTLIHKYIIIMYITINSWYTWFI